MQLRRSRVQRRFLSDLEKRAGLKIKRIVVGKVNFMRDIANLKILYDDPTQGGWLHDADPVLVLVSKEE